MRINIEDTLLSDYRFKALIRIVGDEDKAVGLCYRFWRAAAGRWAYDELISEEQFRIEGFSPLEQVGLAEKTERGYYAKGSDRFEWYAKNVSNASKAGKASAAARKQKFGTAQPKSRTPPEQPFEESPNTSNLLPPPLPPALSPTLKEGRARTPSARTSRAPKNAEGVQKFIAAYVESYQGPYGASPIVTGPEASAAKSIVKSAGSVEKAIALMQAYLANGDRWFVENHHNLRTLYGNMTKVSNAAARKAPVEVVETPKQRSWHDPFTNSEQESAFQAWWDKLPSDAKEKVGYSGPPRRFWVSAVLQAEPIAQ